MWFGRTVSSRDGIEENAEPRHEMEDYKTTTQQLQDIHSRCRVVTIGSYISCLVFIHFSGPCAFQRKFCWNRFQYTFWGSFKTNFQVEHKHVYCSEDEYMYLWWCSKKHLVLEASTSLGNLNSFLVPFEMTRHHYYLQVDLTFGTKQNFCKVEIAWVHWILLIICNCWESAPSTRKIHSRWVPKCSTTWQRLVCGVKHIKQTRHSRSVPECSSTWYIPIYHVLLHSGAHRALSISIAMQSSKMIMGKNLNKMSVIK